MKFVYIFVFTLLKKKYKRSENLSCQRGQTPDTRTSVLNCPDIAPILPRYIGFGSQPQRNGTVYSVYRFSPFIGAISDLSPIYRLSKIRNIGSVKKKTGFHEPDRPVSCYKRELGLVGGSTSPNLFSLCRDSRTSSSAIPSVFLPPSTTNRAPG